jgi:urease accessory protein
MPLNAKLHIETELRKSRTVLKRSFASQPYKLADITEDKKQKFLQLMLMNSSPGILDGDEYNYEIIVGENCSLQLHTQSYQRLFTMKNAARQVSDFYLQEGASLIYLQHPLVPHKNSSFVCRNNIYLKNNCELIWGEVMSCGRKENGEVFQFTTYQSTTKVYLDNKLVVKENILLRPGEIDLTSIGQLEGFTHQASLIYLNQHSEAEPLVNMVMGKLSLSENIEFGLSLLPVKGMTVRVMGYKAEQLFALLQDIGNLLKSNPGEKPNLQIHVA